MRVFTLALVASSALLSRPDGVSEATAPAPMKHQDPAVAPLAPDGENSPPSRVLRSQRTMVMSETLEPLWLEFRNLMGQRQPESVDQFNLPELLNGLLSHPELRPHFESSLHGPEVLAFFEAKNDVGVVKQLFVMREQGSTAEGQHLAKMMCEELVKRWVKDGKTPSQVFELLGLNHLSFDELFLEPSSGAVSGLRDFCEAAEPGRGEIVYLETATEKLGGDAIVRRFFQLSTDKLSKVERLIHSALSVSKLPEDMIVLKFLTQALDEAIASAF